MLRDVAGQKIGAQLVSASDGSAFTGSVTVAVTGDAGTQATGSVGSGACTHEGGGYHTYAPAQAETNYDLVAFTFSGSGAVPVTVQVYTLPSSGVASQASVDAVAGYVDTEVAAIKAKTDNLPSDPADASDIAASFGTVNTTLGTIAGYIDTEVAAIKAKTDLLPADPADASDIAALIDAIPTAAENAASLLDLAAGVETGLTLRQALRLIAAAAAGKISGAATTTIVIRNAVADSKDRISATVDADGNRSAVTVDLT